MIVTETVDEEIPPEMIEDDEPFSSARSSFSSDASARTEYSGSELSNDLETLQLPKKTETIVPSLLKQLTDSTCLIQFSELKEETGMTFQFAVVSNKRYTYIGWFYAISPISGLGYSFNSDGSFYVGEFNEGKKSGFGQFYYDNGSHYDGYWKNDQKQGEGRFFFNKDLYYSGKWNENKMVECKLEYISSGSNDINGIYSCIGTHNDYIFFKQAQLSISWRSDSCIDLDDIDINLLEEFLSTPSGQMFFNPSFNLIEEMNITSAEPSKSETSVTLTKLINLLPSFPFLKYVSLASMDRVEMIP